MWSSLQNFSNSYEWGSSWRTTWKARLCKTWLRWITSPLSPGSDELLVVIILPTRELWKHFSFHHPPFLKWIPLWHHHNLLPSSRLGSSRQSILTQEKNTDVTKALLTINITRVIGKTYQSKNFFFFFSLIVFSMICLRRRTVFHIHTLCPAPSPSMKAHMHAVPCGTFKLSSLCRKKMFPTLDTAVPVYFNL